MINHPRFDTKQRWTRNAASATKPGDWVVISRIGGLGHMAVYYARAMGLNVAAVDIDDAKFDLAQRLGAALTANARNEEPQSSSARPTEAPRACVELLQHGIESPIISARFGFSES